MPIKAEQSFRSRIRDVGQGGFKLWLPAIDDLLGLHALLFSQLQLLGSPCGGSDVSLAGQNEERVSLDKVLWNAPAGHGHQPKHVLGLGKPLRGGTGEPPRGFCIIRLHAFAPLT
jgi:hypothetical protein